jgi:hypothetical protein
VSLFFDAVRFAIEAHHLSHNLDFFVASNVEFPFQGKMKVWEYSPTW